MVWPVLVALLQYGDRYYAPDGPPMLLTHRGCGGERHREARLRAEARPLWSRRALCFDLREELALHAIPRQFRRPLGGEGLSHLLERALFGISHVAPFSVMRRSSSLA